MSNRVVALVLAAAAVSAALAVAVARSADAGSAGETGDAAGTPNDAPPTQDHEEVDRLIDQLSADDWRRREEAVDGLVRLGDVAAGRVEALLSGEGGGGE